MSFKLDDYYTVKEFAEKYSKPENTVQQWCWRGMLPAKKNEDDGKLYIDKQTGDEYMKQRMKLKPYKPKGATHAKVN